MARFLLLPPDKLEADTLTRLLEEFASRDGTDYGEYEKTLEEKVGSLQRQLLGGELCLVFDTESETWDLLSTERADELLDS